MRHLSCLALVLTVATLALLAPVAHANGMGGQAVTFQVTDIQFALAWVDSGNSTALNPSVAKTYHDQYVNTTWMIDSGMAKVTTRDGKPLATLAVAQTQDGTQFFPHGRSGGAAIDGAIFRGLTQSDGSTDMSQGWADLYLVLPSTDGKSWASVHLAGPLQFR